MLNIQKVYYIIDEIFSNGMLVEINNQILLGPIKVLDNIK